MAAAMDDHIACCRRFCPRISVLAATAGDEKWQLNPVAGGHPASSHPITRATRVNAIFLSYQIDCLDYTSQATN